jgi:hypothetical protein
MKNKEQKGDTEISNLRRKMRAIDAAIYDKKKYIDKLEGQWKALRSEIYVLHSKGLDHHLEKERCYVYNRYGVQVGCILIENHVNVYTFNKGSMLDFGKTYSRTSDTRFDDLSRETDEE